MGLTINSKIAAIRSNKKSNTTTLHFIAVDPDGNRRMDTVHPNEGFDHTRYRVGQEIEIHVAPFYNSKTDQIEFDMIDESAEDPFAITTNGAGHSASMSRQ